MTSRSDTFRVDNVLIQNAPKTFGTQLYLPGLAPFGPFDYWSTLALYSLLDPENPTGEVFTTYTELLATLQFTREVSNALEGHETYSSDAYNMVEESLHRLFTVEVDWRAEWAVRLTDQHGKPTRGRPKKQWVEYRGRILSGYGLVYPPGVTPPSMQPASKRENVNRAKTINGEPAPPIWRNREGPRPSGIVYRLAPELVKGLTRENPNIGATILPLRIFALRKTIGYNPTTTRLLIWVCRQTKRDVTRKLDGLADELNLSPRRRGRNRDTLVGGFDLLKTSGVIEGFTVAEDEAGLPTVTFTKASDWYFPAGEERKKAALPGPATG